MLKRIWLVAMLMTWAAAVYAAGGAASSETLTLRFKNEAGQWVTLNQPGVLYLVDFWTIGCRPCLMEMPELISLEDEFENDPRVRFVSVDTEARSAATARKQLESHGIRPNRLFIDADGWFNRLQIESWPTKLLIRDGKVLRVTSGAFPRGNADHWRDEIRAFLKTR